MERRLINAKELADYLGTTVGGVYQRVSRREVPFVRIGQSTRFDLQEINRWIKKQSVNAIETSRI